ncbi:hypothetical protein DFR48_101116 [Ciceribacter lividus]|uniref:Uncharacterized protein n=1 Tax=Ciceribacter lividus TaxID=1197950 RepID=A0A6I7HVH4_9HYPH|nr:hypothetical protein DFR48_101116 [Ciceribacter lividus]
MASSPTKFVRFLVWCSVEKDYREDALTALDEGFEQAYSEFGPISAHIWSVGQAVRSLPYGLIMTLAKFGASIAALVS